MSTDEDRESSSTQEDESPSFKTKRGGDPPNYEAVLSARKEDLRQEEFPNLLLFPQQDVIAKPEPREHRTIRSTVPSKALEAQTTLFTHECLKFYSSHWERVTYNYAKYSGSYALLLDEEARETLPHLTFERDQLEAEAMKEQTDGSLKQVSKRGYLHKGPFPSELPTVSTTSLTTKSYRKFWFDLRAIPQSVGGSGSGGVSYSLMYYRDDKSIQSVEGMIPVETIADIKKNPKHKPYGFDLMTEDDKTVYPLAAETEKEMDEWIEAMKKAFKLDNEEQAGGASVAAIKASAYNNDTLTRDTSKKSLLRPELLQYSEGGTEKENKLNRQAERNDLFILYPELMHEPAPEVDEGPCPVPKESLGVQIHVACQNLLLKMSLTRSGISQLLEPFFIKLALFDAQKGVKISEDFHVDLNEANIRSLLPKRKKLVRVGLDYEEIDYDEDDEDDDTETNKMEALVNSVKEAVFSVLFPNPDIYLVARIEKVLHGTIQSCAEPYQKTGDVTKTADKLSKQMSGVCARLGVHRMPFAWTARPVFKGSNNVVDQTSEFIPLFRQDKDRLTDEDLLRYLSDFRNIGRYKLPVIAGGSLKAIVSPFNGSKGGEVVLSPAYVPLKNTASQQAQKVVPTVKEIREFTPFHAYEPHNLYDPHLTLNHTLYVYPLSLNYESQKNFAKARNLAIKVEFKEADYGNSQPLKVIYSRSVGEAYTTKAISHVLYHSQSPTFYEEVKIRLPLRISRRHHVLLTFLHVSCDLPKSKSSKSSTKLPPVETVVGYSWIPLLESDGKIASSLQNLPVATTLPPGYLSTLRGDLKKSDIKTPDIQWVDGGKHLLKARINMDSTIYTEDSELFTFFAICDHVQRAKPVAQDDLKFAIDSLEHIDFLSLFHVPVLLNMLLKLLCISIDPVPQIKMNIMNVLISLINKLVSIDRQDILKGYIEYTFMTEVDPISGQAIHDELVSLLIQYFAQIQKSKEGMKILNFVPFFFNIILKSMAQYLGLVGKENASRKARYPAEFGDNLQVLIEKMIPCVIVCHALPTGTRANRGLGAFLKRCFSFMDRGVVFKIIKNCIRAFDKETKEDVVLLKLEFLTIVCEHEHFVPLNLPFKQKTADISYELNDEYCNNHYLMGVVLTEVARAFNSSSSTVRQKAIGVLRNLLAKLDSDERFTTPTQKGRIAMLLFPIIPLTIKNFRRLKKSSSNKTDQKNDKKKPSQSESAATTDPPQSPSPSTVTDEDSLLSSVGKKSVGGAGGGARAGAKRSLINDLNSASKNPPRSPSGMSDGTNTLPSHGRPSQSSTNLSGFQSLTKSKDHYSADTLDMTSLRDDYDEYDDDDEGAGPVGGVSAFGIEETRDLLICFLFVLGHIEQRVIEHWWMTLLDKDVDKSSAAAAPTSGVYSSWEADVAITGISQLEAFFDIIELCIHTFEYSGRLSITKKWSKRAALLRQLEQSYTTPPAARTKSTARPESSMRSFATNLSHSNSKLRLSRISSSTSLLLMSSATSPGPEDMELFINTEGNLANEVGLIIIETIELFMERFKVLLQDTVDHRLNGKIVSIYSSLLEVNQSTALLKHIFASIKCYIHKFSGVLYRGSPEYCGSICYQLLLCCNSTITSTRAEASALLYILIRKNYEYFNKQQGFVRTDLQMTKALSKIATTDIPRSYMNLRKSLGVIVTYADNDSRVQSGSFSSDLRDLMIRLRTVLSSTSQMKEHRNDPEKLLDLQYSLAKSYANSPELRHTWLESMALLHIEHKNYTEAAQCYLHIAGLVAEYMKVSGKYSGGSRSLRDLSYNVEKEESGIRIEKGASREQRYSEVDLVTFLESSMSLLEQSEHYELTTNVFKLLLPYYQEEKNFKKLTEMYGRLHDCHKKILSKTESGARYLGTYFRVGFYGQLFVEDHKKQFIYRENKVTGLAEITQRLLKLYSRKFGPEIVEVLQESGKVDVEALDEGKAYIQITHVQPYFTDEELQERTTKFEKEHSLSKFMFEVPFTPSGGARGDLNKQHMRKTLLITSHWFPYIVKRILVVRDESWELTPIEVAIEAIGKKRDDLLLEVGKRKHDLVKLQLLLQGCLSPQVNQGALEYANVFLTESDSTQPRKFVEQLKEAYRSFMRLCEAGLTVHGQLINESQILLHQDMLHKYQLMVQHLDKILWPLNKHLSSSQSVRLSSSSPSKKRDQLKSATLATPSSPSST